jgi:hypothetical protein
MGVRDIATLAKVSPNTITRLESDLASNASTVAVVRQAPKPPALSSPTATSQALN